MLSEKGEISIVDNIQNNTQVCYRQSTSHVSQINLYRHIHNIFIYS